MNKKEEKIREVLRNREVEVDAAEIWSNIQGALPKKERKGVFLWWFFLVLPLFAFATYYCFQSTEKEVEEKKNLEILKGEELAEIKGDKFPQIEVGTNNVQKFENLSSSERVEDQKNSLSQNSVSLKENSILLNKTQHSDLVESNINIEQSQQVKGANEVKYDPLKNLNSKKMEGRVERRDILTDLALLLLLETPNSALNIDKRDVYKLVQFPSSLVQSTCCQASKFRLTFLSGVNRSFNEIAGIDDSERGLYSWSLDSRLELKLPKRWGLGLGLSFDHLVTRYESNRELILQGEASGISEVNIDELGQSSSLEGQVVEIVRRQEDLRWHRRQEVLDFDLLLFKHFVLGRGFRGSIYGGMAYNLNTSSSGYGYSTAEYLRIEKFKGDPGFYRSMNGLKQKNGLELSYGIGRIEILLNANYEWNLSPINTQTEIFQMKHSQTGIQLGTRYHLNGNKN